MIENTTANAYLRTKVMTASPEELRLMLLDGAIKFANQAKAGLEKSDHEMVYEGFIQCRDIVLELLNTIKSEPAPQIAKAVRELYTYMYGELIKASTEKDIDILAGIIGLLEYERETWTMTMDQVAREREAGIAHPQPAPAPPAAQAHQPISFQA
jgi:flagellar secretion chaperone FliS